VNADAARALKAVPRLRGGIEAIERCRTATEGCGTRPALDALAVTFGLLEASGVGDSVSVDFSVMRDFDYYTGIVLEAYAPGIGVPLGGGGRYDGVLGRFGAPAPAAGFALGVERLSIALVEQGAAPRARRLDAVVGGPAADAMALATRLRAAGWHVALSAREGLELAREADRAGAVEALEARDGRAVRLDRSGSPAGALADPVPYPPSTSWAQPEEAR
jgi:ATP phosphoribosyltransferase regulatory subunit